MLVKSVSTFNFIAHTQHQSIVLYKYKLTSTKYFASVLEYRLLRLQAGAYCYEACVLVNIANYVFL